MSDEEIFTRSISRNNFFFGLLAKMGGNDRVVKRFTHYLAMLIVDKLDIDNLMNENLITV